MRGFDPTGPGQGTAPTSRPGRSPCEMIEDRRPDRPEIPPAASIRAAWLDHQETAEWIQDHGRGPRGAGARLAHPRRPPWDWARRARAGVGPRIPARTVESACPARLPPGDFSPAPPDRAAAACRSDADGVGEGVRTAAERIGTGAVPSLANLGGAGATYILDFTRSASERLTRFEVQGVVVYDDHGLTGLLAWRPVRRSSRHRPGSGFRKGRHGRCHDPRSDRRDPPASNPSPRARKTVYSSGSWEAKPYGRE